jgi:endonuclease/exonuclease/phosphatase family metal-dependent hydrolase
LAQLCRFIAREIPPDAPLLVAGDFNDWSSRVQSHFHAAGLLAFKGVRVATFPSRLPLVQLDHVFARGLQPVRLDVPKGAIWAQMSDHLPLIAEFAL